MIGLRFYFNFWTLPRARFIFLFARVEYFYIMAEALLSASVSDMLPPN